MHPICFYLGPRPIYWYGVMVAAGFLAGMLNWTWLGKRENKPSGYAGDLGFWLMLAGILGSRAAFVIANWEDYRLQPLSVFRIDEGGLIFYGGFIAATASALLFARVKKEKLLPFLDFAITAVPLGQGFGRIGCFLNGCCYGKIAPHLPWSVPIAHAARHPVQLYEAAGDFAIYGLLLAAYFSRRREGSVLVLYMLLYPLLRFVMEFFRGDPRAHIAGATTAQAISLAIFCAGLALWLLAIRKRPRISSRNA